MNLKDLGTQLLFTTAPIWVERSAGVMSSATSFLYNFPVPDREGATIPFLVTNFHVVEGASRALVELVQREGEGPSADKRIRVEIDGKQLVALSDKEQDIAILPIGPVLNDLESSGRPVFFRSLGPELIPTKQAVEELSAVEEIVFIGYPSGLRDQVSAMPVIRRGITATPFWSDFERRPEFLIDAGVFPGSSGSPVFIFNQGPYSTRRALLPGNRLLFLGILSESIIRHEGAERAYLGLGKVRKSTALKNFIEAKARNMAGSGKNLAGNELHG